MKTKTILALALVLTTTSFAHANEEDLQDGACLVYTVFCKKMENTWGREDEETIRCLGIANEGVSYNVAQKFSSLPGITFLQTMKQNQILDYVSGNVFTDREIQDAWQPVADYESNAKNLSILKRGRKKDKLVDFDVEESC